MSVEADIYAALGPLCANRVYPDVLPHAPTLPAIVYQQVGGQPLAFLELTRPDKANGRFQIKCWAATRAAAATLQRRVEGAMIESATLTAEMVSGATAVYDEELDIYGTIQDFSIWFAL